MFLVDKVKELIFKMNENGIPMPLIRDPAKDGPPISFTFYYVAGWLAIFSIIGKFTKLLGEIDVSGANYLFLTAAAMHLGHKMTSDGKNNITMEKDEDKPQ